MSYIKMRFELKKKSEVLNSKRFRAESLMPVELGE
jgi:hypothetical protein